MFWYVFLIVCAVLLGIVAFILCVLMGEFFTDPEPTIAGLVCLALCVACALGASGIGRENTVIVTENVQMVVHEKIEHAYHVKNDTVDVRTNYYLWLEDSQGERRELRITWQEYGRLNEGDTVTVAVTTATKFGRATKSYDLVGRG